MRAPVLERRPRSLFEPMASVVPPPTVTTFNRASETTTALVPPAPLPAMQAPVTVEGAARKAAEPARASQEGDGTAVSQSATPASLSPAAGGPSGANKPPPAGWSEAAVFATHRVRPAVPLDHRPALAVDAGDRPRTVAADRPARDPNGSGARSIAVSRRAPLAREAVSAPRTANSAAGAQAPSPMPAAPRPASREPQRTTPPALIAGAQAAWRNPRAGVAAPAPAPVEITIDRIEVRAEAPASRTGARRPPPGPKLTLDDYLQGRRGGRR
jgi:hypothetical protein